MWYSVDLARRLPWRALLLAVYGGGLAWLFSLALVDGKEGIGRILDTEYEYLRTARATTDLPATLREFVSRIPYDGLADDIEGANWPAHVAGHPPGALAFFVLLARIGLGSGLAAGIVITLIAASTAVAVLITLRLLGAEMAARRAAPFLVFGPMAIWQAVSADAMFAAVAAWGIAALAAAATRRSVLWATRGRAAARLLRDAVLRTAVARCPRRRRTGRGAQLEAVALGCARRAHGRAGVRRPRVRVVGGVAGPPRAPLDGVANNRPAAYWMWGNLAALAFSAGPLAGAGLAMLCRRTRDLDLGADAVRVIRWLAGAGVVMVLLADVSQMSKAEVERIWLPFVPWLLISCALLPDRWRRIGVAVQVLVAIVVQHLLFTGW